MKNQKIHGSYTDAVIYTIDNPAIAIDDYALAQIQMICNHPASKGCKIRIMPDVHPGKAGPIGLTMTISDRVLPQLVGIDIGCGMTMARLSKPKLEFQKLDTVIRENIPSGFCIHSKPKSDFDLEDLKCISHIRRDKALCSLGTLGGGNHFIELDTSETHEFTLTVHSGSRHLGKEIAEYYCREGQRLLNSNGISEPYETTWLEGELMNDYLHDIRIAQEFARINRETILKTILKKMKWKTSDEFISCSHNDIDVFDHSDDSGTSDNPLYILRKGAISARKDEIVIIPVHMKDGIILGKGRGNPEWNCSAPHGSGRLYKRSEVQNLFSMSSYKKIMNGIYTSCVHRSTLDESPFCYRSIGDILPAIHETVEVIQLLKPLYNYKDYSEKRDADTD